MEENKEKEILQEETAGTAGADGTAGNDMAEEEKTAEEKTAEGSPEEEPSSAEPEESSRPREDGPEDAPAGDQEEPKKTGFFGKKKKDKKDQQIEELTDRVQRQMAEFDNFRKRSEKEKAAMYEMGARSVIEKILPTVDNFERGFSGLTDEQREDPFAQGMEKVYRQFLTELENMGVKPIEAMGQEFDPNFHNAVMHVEDEEAGENTVVEEFQKGYLYRDAVIRHSMVKVAN